MLKYFCKVKGFLNLSLKASWIWNSWILAKILTQSIKILPLCKVKKYCSVFLLSLWTGFLASLPKPLGINNSLDITEDIELCPLYHIKSKKFVPLHDQIVGSPDVFVYGIQGKSRNVSLWPLHNLLASNANLREVDPNREAETGQYLLPQEGIQSVLCNKIVILHSWNFFLELFWWVFLLAVLMSFNYHFFLIFSMMVSFYEQMPSCAILCDSRTKTKVY